MTQTRTPKLHETTQMHSPTNATERSQAPKTLIHRTEPERITKPLLGSWFDRWLSLGLFVAATMMLGFYLTITYHALFNSDAAMKLMLAEQMASHFTLFPRDWNYVNDIPIIFPSLIAAPLSWFFAPSLGFHSFVDVVAAGLVVYAAFVAARAVGIRGPLRWLLPTLLASGFSGEFAEWAFGQSAYSSPLFILLLLAGWGARYLAAAACTSNNRHQQRLWDIRGIAILLVASMAAGPRGLATYAAPFLLASAGVYVLSGTEGSDLRNASKRLVVGAGAATIAGGLIFLLLLKVLRFNEGAIAQTFSDNAQISNHLQLVVSNWLSLFDALPPSGQKFSVIWAALFAARLGVALFVFCLPLLLLLRVGSIVSVAQRFLVLLHAAVLASTLYLLIFTGVVIDEVHGAPRYLIPLIPTALLIAVLWLQEIGQAWDINAARVGWILALILLALSPMQLLAPAFSQWPDIHRGFRSNPRASLVAALQKAGLHRGFAGYWNASVVSVLSGGDVRVAPVPMSDGTIPAPWHHLTSEQWYASDWATGSTFLLLDGKDSIAINRPALDAALGAPARMLQVDGFEVLIYPFNIGERLGFSAQAFVRLPRMTQATCAADYAVIDNELRAAPGGFGSMRVRATNHSTITWSQDSIPYFNPGLRIVDTRGRLVAESRGLLPHATKPGESVVLTLPFRSPAAVGAYTLYFSFVAEGDAWCGDFGANWAKSSLTVKP
jgi:hypothetical protein